MKHRSFLCLTVIMLYSYCVSAQQKPQYTQYVMNNYVLNPALSGIENYIDLRIGHRQQWQGLQNAPKTSFVSANWALGKEYLWGNALSFEQDGNDPRGRNYAQYYTASPAHHGMGIYAVSDKAGALSTAVFNLSYAYHLAVGQRLNLSLGLSAGVSRTAIDENSLLLENPNDPALSNAGRKLIRPDLAAGVWLYGRRFFSGLAVQQLVPNSISFHNDSALQPSAKQVPHVFLTGGYKFDLSEDISTTPSILVKWIAPAPTSVDFNVKMAFRDQLWLGAGYRKDDAASLMAGFNISHLVNLTYSYDFTTSELNRVSNGSHEVVLGILLNNVYKVVCPQRMW
ncbi:type IX secretion system membrane protein PorP/SprF [Pedobacter sp.]|uniref:PorP/SprF family type IX secretion system membrane protein n=1 Tax=Pedobacter sp. TaxID=1411316 RepID=UPI003BA8A48C